MVNRTEKAVLRIKDRMRLGARLMKSHSNKNGQLTPKFYLVGYGEVSDDIAKRVIADIEVFPGRDGVWPGDDQTWGIGDVPAK